MKRITITLDDDMYASLIDYAADTSKQDLTRLSVSKAIRKLVKNKLAEMNYFPNPKAQQQLQQLIQQRQKRIVQE
jgi:predicted CopG family antitoxin